MRSWEEKINGETEEKKMNRQADFTDGSSSFDDGFDKLYEKIKTMYRDDELETVKHAYDVAKEHHKNQLRQSGEPYIIHPIAVASILADLGMDSQSVAAALLHDTVEDTDVTKADIEREFGDEIAQLVDGVTKLAKVPTETKAEAQAENIRKMLLAMSNDIRVIIIKLAPRLSVPCISCNRKTLILRGRGEALTGSKWNRSTKGRWPLMGSRGTTRQTQVS